MSLWSCLSACAAAPGLPEITTRSPALAPERNSAFPFSTHPNAVTVTLRGPEVTSPPANSIAAPVARRAIPRAKESSQSGFSDGSVSAMVSTAGRVFYILDEGPIGITECIDDTPGECTQEPFCSVRANWQRINEAIRGALEEITLAEMTHPLTAELVTLGGAAVGGVTKTKEGTHGR